MSDQFDFGTNGEYVRVYKINGSVGEVKSYLVSFYVT